MNTRQPLTIKNITLIDKENEIYFIKVRIISEKSGEKSNADYYLRKIGDQYLIDWKSSICFNEIPISEFAATKGNSAKNKKSIFRGNATLNTTFHETRRDQDAYFGLYFRDPFSGPVIHSYMVRVPTRMAGADDLMTSIKDGREHRVILEIQATVNNDGRLEYNVTKILNAKNWLLED